MFEYEYNYDTNVKLEGLFIAKVINSADPKGMERVFVRVIGVHNMDNEDKMNGIWAHHIRPDKTETSALPSATDNDFLYVMFIQGDPNACVWLGWVNYISSEGLI